MKPNQYGEILWWVHKPSWSDAITMWARDEEHLKWKIRNSIGWSRGRLPKSLTWWHNETEWWELKDRLGEDERKFLEESFTNKS